MCAVTFATYTEPETERYLRRIGKIGLRSIAVLKRIILTVRYFFPKKINILILFHIGLIMEKKYYRIFLKADNMNINYFYVEVGMVLNLKSLIQNVIIKGQPLYLFD